MSLQSQFDQAVAESKNLPERPDNMTLLKIYALFKQASAGDVEGKRPGQRTNGRPDHDRRQRHAAAAGQIARQRQNQLGGDGWRQCLQRHQHRDADRVEAATVSVISPASPIRFD